MAQSGLETTIHFIESKEHDCTPPVYFEEALQDAERLLKYAAEAGIDIEDNIRNDVLQARTDGTTGWNEENSSQTASGVNQTRHTTEASNGGESKSVRQHGDCS